MPNPTPLVKLKKTTMTNSPNIIIIGGGISGTAAAYELSKAGAAVTLVEKGTLASMASGWTLAGVRQSGRDPAELPLAQAAVRRWEGLADELQADVEYRQEGNLRLARTAEEVEHIRTMVAEQQALGLDLHFLPDTASVREVAPAMSDNVLAASFCPTDGHANPTATVQAFANAAESLGATIHTETTVTHIDTNDGQVTGVQTDKGALSADMVVIAAGVYSDRLCESVGLNLPLHIKHVSVVQTVPLQPLLKPVLGTANANFAGRQQVDGRMRMTVSSDAWQWPNRPLTADDIQPEAKLVCRILERATHILPILAEARLNRVWGGLLDMTPDGLPVLERSSEVEGLIITAGFSGHGFCLGPITGQIIRELALEGESSLPLESFQLSRFAAGTGEQVGATLHG